MSTIKLTDLLNLPEEKLSKLKLVFNSDWDYDPNNTLDEFKPWLGDKPRRFELLKMYSQGGQLTETKILVVLAHKKPAAMQVTLKKDRLKQYFPQTYTQQQMEDVIFSLLDDWKSQQEGVGAGDENE